MHSNKTARFCFIFIDWFFLTGGCTCMILQKILPTLFVWSVLGSGEIMIRMSQLLAQLSLDRSWLNSCWVGKTGCSHPQIRRPDDYQDVTPWTTHDSKDLLLISHREYERFIKSRSSIWLSLPSISLFHPVMNWEIFLPQPTKVGRPRDRTIWSLFYVKVCTGVQT